MARSRNIKPGFFKNEYVASLSMAARMLFIGLWTLADCEGRLQDRPMKIKMELFPLDVLDVNDLLQELHISQGEFIKRYIGDDGENYIQILNFKKHQNPHKNEKQAGSVFPEYREKNGTTPENNGTSTVLASDLHHTNRADSLILIPDSLIPESGANASVSVNSQKHEISDENKSLAQAGKDYLVSLNHPNFSSPQWVSGYLSVQFDELEKSRPDIPKQEILRMWRDTCDLAVEKNKSAQQWSKSTFKNKLDSWKPAIQTKTVSTPVQYKNHRERLMAAKKIRNIFDGNDVEPSTLRMGNGLIYDRDGRVFPDEEYKVIEDGS